MTTTINISLPTLMYKDAKKILAKRGFASISEFIRATLREELYPPMLTENGFTPEFEERVLRAAKTPRENDRILKSDKDVRDYFLHLKIPKKRKKS